MRCRSKDRGWLLDKEILNHPDVVALDDALAGRAPASVRSRFSDAKEYIEAQPVILRLRLGFLEPERALLDYPDNFHVALHVVSERGHLLEYASVFRDHVEICVAAVKQDARAFEFVGLDCSGNFEIVKLAVERRGEMLRHASGACRNNFDLATLAIGQTNRAWNVVGLPLRYNPDVIEFAIKKCLQAK